MARPDTLRARLTLWYVAVLGVALAVFAVMLYLVLNRTLYSHHDRELEADANRLRTALASGPFDQQSIETELGQAGSAPPLVMVRDSTGALLYRSPVLQVAEPSIGHHEALVHAAAHGSAQPEFFTADLEQTGAVRFICTRIGPESSAYLQIGSALGDVPATLRAVATASVVLVPLVLLLTVVGGWAIAGRALAPIAAIDATLRAIEATDLSKRVEVAPADLELQGLVRTVNGLLARLQQSFADLRNFAADVSHQLKTPLAIIQITVDQARASGQSGEAFEAVETELKGLSEVMTDLQTLNLVDSSARTADTGRLDFSRLSVEAAEIVQALGEEAGVNVTADIAEGVYVSGRSAQLRQLVLNLGDNAVKFTPAGGRVSLRLRASGSKAVLSVSDTGGGISPQDLPRIFDRFYQASNRAGRSRGSGLGLAIAQRIATVHGGVIHVTSPEHAGTTFTLELPIA